MEVIFIGDSFARLPQSFCSAAHPPTKASLSSPCATVGADGAVFVDFAPVGPVPGFSDPVSTERPKFGPGEISMGGGSGGALGPGEIFSTGGGDGGAPTLPLDSGTAAGEGVT